MMITCTSILLVTFVMAYEDYQFDDTSQEYFHDAGNDTINCECGLSKEDMKIVAGTEAVADQFPWLGLIVIKNRPACGSTLISDRYVVTGAHCLKGVEAEDIRVRLGVHDLNETDGVTMAAKRLATHDEYEAVSYNNDIALIEFKRPVYFNTHVRPVCLAKQGVDYEGETATVAGWGYTKPDGNTSNFLMTVDLPILSTDYCRKNTVYYPHEITDNMMCAGYESGGKDACQGDSGGPLMMRIPGRRKKYELIGIISFGLGCAKSGQPGVYTKLVNYLDWIRKEIEDSRMCSE